MVIPPSTIIMLSDDKPIVRPQLSNIAIAAACKGGAFRTKIGDTEYYLAFTENTKSLFYDDVFLGGMITVRRKGERINSNLESHTFFMHADAVAIDARPGSVLLSPVGGNWPILFYNNDDIGVIRHQYRIIYTWQLEQNPTKFEMNWGNFTANRPDFHYHSGHFTF